VAAVASALSAAASFWLIRTEARSHDFDSCLDLIERLGVALRRVRDAQDDGIRDFEFRELLNLMEGLALLENQRRIPKATRKFAKTYLIETYAFLRSEGSTRVLLDSSVTGVTTFDELMQFYDRNRAEIDGLSVAYQKQRKEREASEPASAP
jgi:hypothetical protein